MRILTGIDIIKISRIKESIENIGETFKEKIYTEKEIEYCESRRNAKYQHYAGRFAAKEAIFKAVSDLLENKFEISWKDAQVLNDKNGKPKVEIFNQTLQEKIEDIDISISHCKEYAAANVVIICK